MIKFNGDLRYVNSIYIYTYTAMIVIQYKLRLIMTIYVFIYINKCHINEHSDYIYI